MTRLSMLFRERDKAARGPNRLLGPGFGDMGRFPLRPSVVGVLAALAIALSSACSFLLGPQPEIGLSFHDFTGRDLSLNVDMDGSIFLFEAPETRTVNAPGTGPMSITVHLFGPSGALLLTRTFEHSFEEGFSHWLGMWAGGTPPREHCSGGVTPIGTVVSDTVFLRRGALRDGTVC